MVVGGMGRCNDGEEEGFIGRRNELATRQHDIT
jgi:hypothetical protein